MNTRISLRIATLLALAAVPAAAQARDAGLDARMRAFAESAPDAPNDSVAAFFPRRGDWTWVQAWQREDGGIEPGAGVWRFSGAETPRAIGAGGPVCDSFESPGGAGPFEGRLGMQTRMHRGPWRRVRGTRFVPPGEPASSPVFVEWRREDGAWVVSSFGDVGIRRGPRLLGRVAGPLTRDTTLLPEDAAFVPADQHVIVLGGRRYAKSGTPRALDAAARARMVRIGLLGRVSVFTERGADPEMPYAVYLLTTPGLFQAYDTELPRPCQ
jgi:hypothetical protein